MTRVSSLLVLAVAALTWAATSNAEDGEWLPPQMEEGLVQQLAERMVEIGMVGGNEAQRLEGARQVIGAIRQRLEALGDEGLVRQAPSFPALSVPHPDQRHLDAIGRLTLCNLILVRQHMHRAQQDENGRAAAVLGLSAMTAATLRLRHLFIAEGGAPDAVEALVTGKEMEVVFNQIQESPELITHVEQQCTPPAHKFLEYLVSDQ